MHTLIVIAEGIALLIVFVVAARVSGKFSDATAAKAFIPIWLACAIVNMAIGVMQAGYTVAEELPILLVVFAVPAAIAAVFWRIKR